MAERTRPCPGCGSRECELRSTGLDGPTATVWRECLGCGASSPAIDVPANDSFTLWMYDQVDGVWNNWAQ